jgi:predicted nucleotidyltransferase
LVAKGDNRSTSDMDFLVEVEDSEPKVYSKRFFGLLHSLEDTFHCNIGLLTSSSIKRKSLRNKVEKDRISLYERCGIKGATEAMVLLASKPWPAF